jgi:hypothetical protein
MPDSASKAEHTLSAGSGTAASAGPPTFIACNARSGSTLLRWIVDTHPEMACPAETDLPVLLESYVAAGRAVGLEGSLARARDVADELMSGYVVRQGKSRWCDKSLSNVQHLDTLTAVWPEARFILLHRHCMDFVMSAIEAQPWGLKDYGFAPFAAVTPTDTITALLAYWIERTSKMLLFEERHPDRCLRVRYEDLVLDTEGVLAGMWPFLGLQPVEDAAGAAFRSSHDAIGPADYKVWYTEKVHDESIGRGGRIPPDRVPGLARSTVNELLERLGYDLVDDAWGSGGALVLDEATATPGSIGGGSVVELRVVDGHGTIASQRIDLRDAPETAGDLATGIGGALANSAAVSSVVAIERSSLDGLSSGRENIGAALRARTVRYYGPILRSFEEERRIFERVAEHLEAKRPLFEHLLDQE